MEGAHDPRPRQQGLRLLGGAALDVQHERAMLVEAERVDAVDDDLAGELVDQGGQRLLVGVERHGQQDDVGLGRAGRVVGAPHRQVARRGS